MSWVKKLFGLPGFKGSLERAQRKLINVKKIKKLEWLCYKVKHKLLSCVERFITHLKVSIGDD